MYNNIITGLKRVTILILFTISLSGCKKLIQVDLPIDSNTSKSTFSNIGTAIQAVNGIYAMMAKGGLVDRPGISIANAIRADELDVVGGDPDYTWDYNGSEYQGRLWGESYRILIYRINSALEGISKSESLPSNAKKTLSGELLFSRAWMYFLLVNSYGDVPLVVTTDLNVNSNIPRSPVSKVYEQIERDLLDAYGMLNDDFLESDLVTAGSQRIRPNRGAAVALLARIYLYTGRWAEAEIQSSKLIDNPNYELLENIDQVFLMNNRESIWQLQPSDKDPDGYNTPDGRALISSNGTTEPILTISPLLLATFEKNDQRKMRWIGTSPAGARIAYKYKEGWRSYDIKEYTVVFRLAEQYLIRAEARAMQGNLVGQNSASSDLNIVRKRAGLENTSMSTQDSLLNAIDNERQAELFLEWGDRWFNLKRRKKIDQAMSVAAVQKNANWQPYKALLPIPWEDFQFNPSLRGHQNPGYSEQ